jgi:hypothetical protein
VLDVHEAIEQWAQWAGGIVADWDDTRRPGWAGYQAVYDEAAARAVAEVADGDA